MTEAIETISEHGLTARIFYDECGEHADPRQWDQLGTMTCWHPDYALGDEQVETPDGRGYVKNAAPHSGRFKSLDVLARYISLARGALVVLPLYVYEHSGITISVGKAGDYPFDSAGWDSTNVGFIWTSEKRIAELCGDGEQYREPAWLTEQLENEVKEYALYLEGQVFYFVIENEEGDVVESCGGFLGHEVAIEMAKDAMKGAAAQETYVDAVPIEYALAGVTV
jgi:hypothetical protein